MNRRERRKRKRERKRKDQLARKSLKISAPAPQERTSQQKTNGILTRTKRFLGKAVSGTKLVKSTVFGGLALLSGYALIHPHVSVEPGVQLDSSDPFSTEFEIKNENAIFAVHDVYFTCTLVWVVTSRGPMYNVFNHDTINNQRVIPEIAPNGGSSGVACEGLTSSEHLGQVMKATIEINLSYRQKFWPFDPSRSYPFVGVRDIQNVVHWTRASPSEIPKYPSHPLDK